MKIYETRQEFEDWFDADFSEVVHEKSRLRFLMELKDTYYWESRKWETLRDFAKAEYNGEGIEITSNGEAIPYVVDKKVAKCKMSQAVNRGSHCDAILRWIEKEIEEEKRSLLRVHVPLQNSIGLNIETIEKSLPDDSEIDKIRLLHKTGIIDFLQDRFVTNPNQIAKFFEFISSKP